MKIEDIRALRGEVVAVEFPRSEAGLPYGSGNPPVKATVLEAPVTGEGRGVRSKPVKGARLRLEEPFRIIVRDGFEELPVGHEFFAESRLVDHVWGSHSTFRELSDDERVHERAARYAEQDAIRASLTATGLREGSRGIGGGEGFMLRGDDVVIGREVFAWWLSRGLGDPVALVESVLAEVHREPARDEDEHLDRVDRATARLRRRLAMTREEERAAGAAFEEALREPAPEDVYGSLRDG